MSHRALTHALAALSFLTACGGAADAPNLDTLTASEAAAGVCAGRWTSAALVAASLARAKARQP